MPRREPGSLWEALSANGDRGGRFLSGIGATVPFDDLAHASSLGGKRESLGGRSVLLAMKDQLAAALAMIELDGLARRIVLSPPDIAPAHLAAISGAAEVDAVLGDARLTLTPETSPSGAARRTEWVLLTSGTTGVPKLVVHDLASLGGPALGAAAVRKGAVWSTFYDIRRYGGLAILFRALLGGGSLMVSSAAETTGDFLARAQSLGVTHISGTPSHWRRALMSPEAHDFRPHYVRLSGEIADQALLDRLRAFWPEARVAHAFASTEAGLAFEINDGRAGFPAALVGASEGDVALAVRDGSLRVRSSRTALRYLGTEGALKDESGFVDTGDVVELRGERYHFAGRRDGIINVGGFKVHPEEVEAVINAHPQVRMALVKARPNPFTGAIVTAEVVPRDPARADEGLERAIIEACRRALERHKVPAAIRFVSALAVAPSGKLRRHDG